MWCFIFFLNSSNVHGLRTCVTKFCHCNLHAFSANYFWPKSLPMAYVKMCSVLVSPQHTDIIIITKVWLITYNVYICGVLAKHSIMVRASIRLSRFCLSCSSTASSSSPIKQARENRNSPFLKVAREYGVEGKVRALWADIGELLGTCLTPRPPHHPTPHSINGKFSARFWSGGK